MAGTRHTMRVVARANEITGAAATRARLRAKTLRVLSNTLADELEQVHGERFRVEILHTPEPLILIRRDGEAGRIDKSALREAV